MRQDIVELLESPERARRMQGLTLFHDACAASPTLPSKEDISYLRNFLYDEEDEGVRLHALILLVTEIMSWATPDAHRARIVWRPWIACAIGCWNRSTTPRWCSERRPISTCAMERR